MEDTKYTIYVNTETLSCSQWWQLTRAFSPSKERKIYQTTIYDGKGCALVTIINLEKEKGFKKQFVVLVWVCFILLSQPRKEMKCITYSNKKKRKKINVITHSIEQYIVNENITWGFLFHCVLVPKLIFHQLLFWFDLLMMVALGNDHVIVAT